MLALAAAEIDPPPLAIGEGRGAELADETNPSFTNAWNVCGEWMGTDLFARIG